MPTETFFNLPEEKQRSIIDIAIDEFAENPYEAVSISQMVRRAGIAKGSFYQYFEDKRDLYLHLFEMIVQEKQAFLQQAPPPSEDMDVFEHLRWVARAGASFELSHPKLAKFGYRVVTDDVPLPEETLAIARTGGRTFFEQFMRNGVEQGVIDPNVDAGVAAFLFDLITVHFGQYMVDRLEITPDELTTSERYPLDTKEGEGIFDALVDILQNGLGPREARK